MTSPLATIIIPIAPYHLDIAQRAIQSVASQTVSCTVLPLVDDEGRGAGWARNRGIEQVTTEFVVFLDADDLLLPNFVERCWSVFHQAQRYVYTDFMDDSGLRHNAPDCAFTYRLGEPVSADPMVNAHAVTALMPTVWARQVGGFDETLTGGEDSEFYIHLGTEGLCGTRLPEALFIYTNAPDSRSKRFRATGQLQAYTQLIEERYEGKIMGCCQEPAQPKPELDRAAPGLVLVRPRWGGNRQERGVITGVLYPRADKSAVIEMDPRDAAARTDLYDVIAPVIKPSPPVHAASAYVASVVREPDLAALARHALQIKPPPPQPPPPPPPAPVVPTTPNVSRVVQIAQSRVIPRSDDGGWRLDGTGSVEIYDAPQADVGEMPLGVIHTAHLKRTDEPVFVFPDKDYPSYTDVRRLVELSGFEAIRITDSAKISDDAVLIYLSPEQPYSFTWHPKRSIWWSLEYGGEYEPNLSDWKGEVWASDITWASERNAKFVVMGSHPGLGSTSEWMQKRYDATMLGYMTPRRQTLRDKLSDLAWDEIIYPGYGDARDVQLLCSRLMLHVHQHDRVQAIAPQRIAVAAAYHLPLIHEQVASPGDYGKWIPFVAYENLNAEVRSQLSMYAEGLPQARGEMLHDWLCKEWTFRRCIEESLK